MLFSNNNMILFIGSLFLLFQLGKVEIFLILSLSKYIEEIMSIRFHL